MKKIELVAVLWLVGVSALAGCRSSTETTPLSPAPRAGALFLYDRSTTASDHATPVTLHEAVTITRDTTIGGTHYDLVPLHTSDVVSGASADGMEFYNFLQSGDWSIANEAGCFNIALPVVTHRSYFPTGAPQETPIKQNGEVGTGTVSMQVTYQGVESVSAAGQTFRCDKFLRSTTITASYPSGPADTVRASILYWYSPDIGYFVKFAGSSDNNAAHVMRQDFSSIITRYYR